MSHGQHYIVSINVHCHMFVPVSNMTIDVARAQSSNNEPTSTSEQFSQAQALVGVHYECVGGSSYVLFIACSIFVSGSAWDLTAQHLSVTRTVFS